jgi:thiol:disulfide interchange protein DsbA
MPVSFGRAAWANLARLYFTLALIGALERLDQAVFDAIHAQRTQLFTKDRILEWVARQGVDAEAFASTFDSFAVQARLGRSDQLVRAYQVDAVPLLTVDGRYAVLTEGIEDHADLFRIADGLIEQARSHPRRA